MRTQATRHDDCTIDLQPARRHAPLQLGAATADHHGQVLLGGKPARISSSADAMPRDRRRWVADVIDVAFAQPGEHRRVQPRPALPVRPRPLRLPQLAGLKGAWWMSCISISSRMNRSARSPSLC